MPSNVSPEEVEALLDDAKSPATKNVALRDFRQPRRLSREQQLAVRAAVAQRLLGMERELRGWLRADYPLQLLEVGETSSVGLFEHLEDPIVVLTVEVGGASGWVVWENPAALAAVAVAMGSEPPENTKGLTLTPLEAGLTGDILLGVARQVGDVLGIEINRGKMSLDVRNFVAQLDPSCTADSQRLSLHLGLDGPGGESTIRFYLPGLLPQREGVPLDETPTLPGHLDGVPVEITARLGSIEVPLEDLMRVEVGDVIPLGLPVGDPLEIMMEGRPAGKASWGSFRGRLALRIEHLDSERESKQS